MRLGRIPLAINSETDTPQGRKEIAAQLCPDLSSIKRLQSRLAFAPCLCPDGIHDLICIFHFRSLDQFRQPVPVLIETFLMYQRIRQMQNVLQICRRFICPFLAELFIISPQTIRRCTSAYPDLENLLARILQHLRKLICRSIELRIIRKFRDSPWQNYRSQDTIGIDGMSSEILRNNVPYICLSISQINY